MFDFYNEIFKLKNIERKGWLIRNVKNTQNNRVESDAEHTCSMCLLALNIISKENLNLNIEKVLKMCLYHELGEIYVGDITPYDNVSVNEKYKMENEAVEKLSTLAQMPEMLSLWREFEENKTEEAKFVKMIDKLDSVKQAKIYSLQNNYPELLTEMLERFLPIIGEYKKYI